METLLIGPYKINKKLSKVSFEVESDKKGKESDLTHISIFYIILKIKLLFNLNCCLIKSS